MKIKMTFIALLASTSSAFAGSNVIPAHDIIVEGYAATKIYSQLYHIPEKIDQDGVKTKDARTAEGTWVSCKIPQDLELSFCIIKIRGLVPN